MRKDFLKKSMAFFCALGFLFGCSCTWGADKGEITVYMPDGAPALALAKLMSEDTKEDGVTYRVVKNDVISSKVTYTDMEKNADFCVLPITAAAQLLGSGKNYLMLGAVTHGNLYILSKTDTHLTDLSSLVGKKVGVLQMAQVPGLTLKATLTKHGVAWQEYTNGDIMSEDKVNLMAISDVNAVGVIEADYFMLAEPAASKQAEKGYSIVGNVQALYGGDGYTQAVLVAKKSFVEKNLAWTNTFTQSVATAAEWLKTASGAEIVSAVNTHMEDKSMASDLKAPLLSLEVLSRCGVRYVSAKDCKEKTNAFLQNLLEVAPKSTAIPSDAFYWNY